MSSAYCATRRIKSQSPFKAISFIKKAKFEGIFRIKENTIDLKKVVLKRFLI